MKIFVSGISIDDSFAENVAVTLKAMGHEVCFPSFLKVNSLLVLGLLAQIEQRINKSGPLRFEKKIINQIKEFKPDMFLSVTQNYSPEFLAEVAKLTPKLVMWWGDPISQNYRMTLLSKSWTAIFLKDKSAVTKLNILGVPAYFLNEAMNPLWHRPLASQQNSSVVIAGNYYNYRLALIELLRGHGVSLELYGSKPPRWAPSEICKIHTGEYITKENKSRIFGAGLACLNSFSFFEGNSLNCRAFEIAGAGGLQLIEYREAIEDCFEPGRELITFSSQEELFLAIERAKKDSSEMKKIREAGQRRAHSEHTYEQRLKTIFDIVC
ncbi:MAG: glycosyltransferase family 1 protein [Bdellovibrionales bacterium]|nr:glycosyltransferase family 1 protein [Bdellovibrionales bacterium]